MARRGAAGRRRDAGRDGDPRHVRRRELRGRRAVLGGNASAVLLPPAAAPSPWRSCSARCCCWSARPRPAARCRCGRSQCLPLVLFAVQEHVEWALGHHGTSPGARPPPDVRRRHRHPVARSRSLAYCVARLLVGVCVRDRRTPRAPHRARAPAAEGPAARRRGAAPHAARGRRPLNPRPARSDLALRRTGGRPARETPQGEEITLQAAGAHRRPGGDAAVRLARRARQLLALDPRGHGRRRPRPERGGQDDADQPGRAGSPGRRAAPSSGAARPSRAPFPREIRAAHRHGHAGDRALRRAQRAPEPALRRRPLRRQGPQQAHRRGARARRARGRA